MALLTQQHYAMLVIMLSTLSQLPAAFNSLGDAELENIALLLRESTEAAERAQQRRLEGGGYGAQCQR